MVKPHKMCKPKTAFTMSAMNQEQQIMVEPTTSLSSKVEKSVRFFGKVQLRDSIHRTHYSADEAAACFYNAKEFTSFKQEVRLTVHIIENHLDIDDERYCRRGAEARTKVGQRLKSRNKMNAWNAVAKELEVQFFESAQDDDSLSTAYSQAAYSSMMAAYFLGLADAKSVRAVQPGYKQSGKQILWESSSQRLDPPHSLQRRRLLLQYERLRVFQARSQTHRPHDQERSRR
jgi:hypothetical protein